MSIECVFCKRKGLREGHFQKQLCVIGDEEMRICDECGDQKTIHREIAEDKIKARKYMHGYLDRMLDGEGTVDDGHDLLNAFDEAFPGD